MRGIQILLFELKNEALNSLIFSFPAYDPDLIIDRSVSLFYNIYQFLNSIQLSSRKGVFQ